MDLLQFEKDMPSEALLLRDRIEKMAKDNHLIELMNQWHCEEKFDKSIIVSMLGDLMSLDTVVGEEYGCLKTNYLTYGLFAEALEAIDSGLRSFLPSVTKGLVRYVIHEFGTEEQKQKYLPGLADGSLIGCFGLTGAHGGSDPKWMGERATYDGPRVMLQGGKNWITNATIADIAVVWMQTGKAGDHRSIRGFVIERNDFLSRPIKNKIGLRASNTGSLFFSGSILETKDVLLPGTEKGLGAAYQCLNQARYSIGWGVIGIAKACFKEAKKFAKETRMIRDDYNNLVPLISSPVMKIGFAELGSRILSMQERAYKAAELIDKAGGINTFGLAVAVSRLKKENVADAKHITDACRQIMGANGLLIGVDNQIPRHSLNIPIIETYEGTPIMHSFIMGEYFTK
ncbi:MAG: acyl-CoA dehydrogenase family protein [bacterium]|nr:acyl-CoA dehydrogenase family protein [bacterium]